MNDGVVVVISSDAGLRSRLIETVQSCGWQPMAMNSAPEFLRAKPEKRAWCLIIDLRCEKTGPMNLLRALGEEFGPLPVVAVTMAGDVHRAVEAVRAGALDVIEEPFTHTQFAGSISDAFKQCARQRDHLLHRHEVLARLNSLTARERTVLARILNGRLNKQIAMELKVTLKTIEAHRSSMMEKLKAGNVVELVRLLGAIEVDLDGPVATKNHHDLGVNPNEIPLSE